MFRRIDPLLVKIFRRDAGETIITDRFLAVGKVTTMAEGTEKVAGKATYAADKIFPQIVWGKAVRSEFPINGLCENLFRGLRLGLEPALSLSKWRADGTQF